MSLYRVCGLAQSLRLKLIKLLLPLVHDNPLLMDPRSLSNAAKELDVILPVTCTATEKVRNTSCGVYVLIHSYTFVQSKSVKGVLFFFVFSMAVFPYLWCWCECGPSSVGQRRPCRATRGRCPPWTTPDLLSQTPYRSLSLGSLMDDGPSEPKHEHEQVTDRFSKSKQQQVCLLKDWNSYGKWSVVLLPLASLVQFW